MRTVFALAAIAAGASAQCTAADYQDWITGLYAGMQFDPTDTTTSCAYATDDLNLSMESMVLSFLTGSTCTDDGSGTYYCHTDQLCSLDNEGVDYVCSTDWTY